VTSSAENSAPRKAPQRVVLIADDSRVQRRILRALLERWGYSTLEAASGSEALALCTDNAAMIAWAGVERLRLGHRDALDFVAKPRWPLDPEAEAVRGAGVKA